MKESLEWHVKCLENWESTMARDREEILNRINSYKRTKKQYLFYKSQVDKAIELKKDSFDRDKFLKNKK